MNVFLAFLFLTASGKAGFVGPTTTTLFIADSSAIEPAANGTVNMNFTVNRTGDLGSRITVGFTTAAGTAQAGTDFTPTTGTTTFASGSPTATISIPIFGNGVYNNPSLTFTVQLTGIVNVVGPPVTMAAQTPITVSSFPEYTEVADFNGDGRPDIAAVASNSLTVALNSTTPGASTPTFGTPAAFGTGTFPTAFAAGDLNGDGRPDIVVANYNSKNISVFFNTTAPGATTASFAAAQNFATGAFTNYVAIGDLNGDGRPDVAAISQSEAKVFPP